MIRVVHRVKYLRLNWIKMCEPVKETQVVLKGDFKRIAKIDIAIR